ncbi:MAG TPA: TraB/GumN family protein [Bacteroidales bacterium]|nr:TraB/GumN family protein [Bacteroidales bacterium]
MKKKKVILPALIAIFAGVITVFIAKSNEEPSDCFTWKVEINESTFYLAGSIHAANEENYPLSRPYLSSYKKADKVIFELEDSFETLENKVFKYAEKDKLPDGLNLGDSLNYESIPKLKRIFEDDKLDKYFKYEGWLLNMAIAGRTLKLIGYDPMLAIDKYFHDLATKDKKEIIGLDEIQTQLANFDFEVPFNIQIKILENTISGMEKGAKKQEGLFKAYFANDLAEFEKEFLKPFDFKNIQVKKFYDTMLTKRNTSWVEKFEELAKGNPSTYFVLVGAGHYFGPNNLLELLEGKGYNIEKI